MKKILCLVFLLPALSFAQGFKDVDETHPNFEAVEWLFQNGLVEGYRIDKKRVFQPENEVSRAAAIKMLIGAAGISLSELPDKESFWDVPLYEWFAPFIETALSMEVVGGFPDGSFHPADPVTRAEMLAMTLRVFAAPLEDSVEGDWETPLLDLAQKFGIINGGALGDSLLNRGEVSEILYRTRMVAESWFSEVFRYSGRGIIQEYPEELKGKKTITGDIIDGNSITAAHRTFPLGTRVRIWNDNHSIVVKINDRIQEDSSALFILSHKAFSLLAERGREEITIDFEVFSSPTDEQLAVPAYIRPNLSPEKQEQPPLPEAISEKVAELRGQIEQPQSIKPVFSEVVTMLPTSFFNDFTMRNSFPLKVIAGTAFHFSGTTYERGYETITVFLQPILENGDKNGEQQVFTGEISGKNFSFPVLFDTPGEFLIGVVLDDERSSRVEIMEVVQINRFPVMALSEKEFPLEFGVRVLPEKQKVVWDLPRVDSTDLLKLTFTQKLLQRSLFISGGLHELVLSYEWFSQFQAQENLAVDLYAAESVDGSVPQRISGWSKLAYKNFDLVPGFFDVETKKVSVRNFPRWRDDLNEFEIEGWILEPNITLKEYAFVTTPEGFVKEIPYTRNGDYFSFHIDPREWGAYAVEIIAEDGEVLFNRELYCSEKFTLPVFPPHVIELPGETVPGVRAWINRVRAEEAVSPVLASAELNRFAQIYADRMASENFLSHISPTGQTFKSRITAANVEGVEFGENLAKGSSLQMALNGLYTSGSHFKNLSARKWKRVGIGISQAGKTWYVSQVFGR